MAILVTVTLGLNKQYTTVDCDLKTPCATKDFG